ncbi:MAG: hypothetical protein GY730_11055 [bacterium]|nr:hypothetical protein [bacterium]
MKIAEYQVKQILKVNGFKVPAGRVAVSKEEVYDLAARIGGPVALKAQVFVKGKMNIGGIKFAGDPDSAKEMSTELIGANLGDTINKKILVEEYIESKKEFYFGFVLDRRIRKNILLFSVSDEDVSADKIYPTNSILKFLIKPEHGITKEMLKKIFIDAGIEPEHRKKIQEFILKLYKIFIKFDAELLEISPMALDINGEFVVLDAKMKIDDNALFRQERMTRLEDEEDKGAIELKAAKNGFSYVRLKGDIGVFGNGAGLVMETMDEVARAGGKPANFLNITSDFSTDSISDAVDLILMDSGVKGIVINIFCCGQCIDVAKSIIAACSANKVKIPVVVRIDGNNNKDPGNIFKNSNLIYSSSIKDAVSKIVEIVRLVE